MHQIAALVWRTNQSPPLPRNLLHVEINQTQTRTRA